MESRRLAAIDGLRGVAILLVVWYHVWLMTFQSLAFTVAGHSIDLSSFGATGYLGVDLFFFLSGFCIFYPYAKSQVAGTPRPTLGHFFSRRALKIVPSYVLCIAVLVGFGYQRYANGGAEFRDLAVHALFIHNWFPDSLGSINGVLWSLGDEVQFYLLFPLIAFCVLRKPSTTLLGLIAVGVLWRWAISGSGLANQYEQLPGVIDLFAVGMLVAYAYWFLRLKEPSIAGRASFWTTVAVLGVLGFICLIQGAWQVRYAPGGIQSLQMQYRTLIALLFGAIALGTLFAHSFWVRIVANPVLIFLAAISYNLYLWHQVIGYTMLRTALFPKGAHDPHVQWVYTFVVVALSLVTATAVTYLFERPILNGRLPLRRIAPRLAPTPVE
jgi:peptidoglycan/LPS O-acetylase OafA/YrhL